jgi:branched-subunit amino acid ABC-type transport system permease component
VGLAVVLWIARRGFYFRWLTLLSVCLLCRELHFWGTSTGIYIAIPLVMWYASANFQSMKPYVNHRLLVSLFVGAFITYFFTITVDRAVWKFLPNHAHWRNNVEETLETFGHLMILAVIVVSAYLPSGKTATDSAS